MEYTYAIVVVVDVVAGFVVIACSVVVPDATVIDNVVAKDNFYYILFWDLKTKKENMLKCRFSSFDITNLKAVS